MGVYIPFMFMPNNCKQCLVNDSCLYLKTASPTIITDYERPINCPLIEMDHKQNVPVGNDQEVFNPVRKNIHNTAKIAREMYNTCRDLQFDDKQAFQLTTLYLKMKSGEEKVWVK